MTRREPKKIARKRDSRKWIAEPKREAPKLLLVAQPKPKPIPFESAWPLANLKGESLGDLLRMLSTCRPHGGDTVESFCRDWLLPIGAQPDLIGNYVLQIGDSPVALWSSHVDTVHRNEGTQRLNYQPQTGLLNLARKSRAVSNCLGADCTVGVWLMREMIKAERPGLYIFHAGEERGGIGSRFIAKHRADMLKGIQVALAFDRRGTKSIITHQAGSRSCSDAFADSLGAALAMGHAADSGGVYTDTAEYVDLIPECSNLSVGYYSEHSTEESLDVPYLFALRDRLLTLDATAFKIERKAGDYESMYEYGGGFDSYGGRAYYGYGATSYSAGRGYSNSERLAYGALEYDDGSLDLNKRDSDGEALERLVRWNPEYVAAYLDSIGIDAVEIADFIYERGGAVPDSLLDARFDDTEEYKEAMARDDS